DGQPCDSSHGAGDLPAAPGGVNNAPTLAGSALEPAGFWARTHFQATQAARIVRRVSAVSTGRPRRTRAERRRLAHRPPAAQATSLAAAVTLPRGLPAAWVGAVVVLFYCTALWVKQSITWYLAVDQYGYLTFAHDLLHGRIFHQSTVIEALAPRLPKVVDVLSQPYVYDHGRLYCRYAPGFPLLLTGWLALFGDDGAPYLNPTVFL